MGIVKLSGNLIIVLLKNLGCKFSCEMVDTFEFAGYDKGAGGEFL